MPKSKSVKVDKRIVGSTMRGQHNMLPNTPGNRFYQAMAAGGELTPFFKKWLAQGASEIDKSYGFQIPQRHSKKH